MRGIVLAIVAAVVLADVNGTLAQQQYELTDGDDWKMVSQGAAESLSRTDMRRILEKILKNGARR